MTNLTRFKRAALTMTMAAVIAAIATGCNKAADGVSTVASTEETQETETTASVEATSEASSIKETASTKETTTARETTAGQTEKATKEQTSQAETTSASEETGGEGVIETETEGRTEEATESTTAASTKATADTTSAAAQQETTTQAKPADTKPAHTHSYTESVTKNPTCTETGVKTFTCACGNSYTESIPAIGHSYGAYTYNNDATTEADGTESAKCNTCGAVDTRVASGTKIVHTHNYSEAITKNATCVENGEKTFTCACGASYTEAIPATGHAFTNYNYNNDATTEADGTKTAKCDNCDATNTKTAEGTKLTHPVFGQPMCTPVAVNYQYNDIENATYEVYFIYTEGDSNGQQAQAEQVACNKVIELYNSGILAGIGGPINQGMYSEGLINKFVIHQDRE